EKEFTLRWETEMLSSSGACLRRFEARRVGVALGRLLKLLPKWRWRPTALLWALSTILCGCADIHDYVNNGFKVGPQYKRPPAPVADHWIDASDSRVRSEEVDTTSWWHCFNDPVLNDLVQTAYRQNLTLREAGFRVLEARAQLGIAIGQLFPQTQ